MDKIIGAKVMLQPGAEEKREAREDGDAPDMPKGKVEDVLLDAGTGQIGWAVITQGGALGIGDRDVAVPFSSLKWNQPGKNYYLDVSVDRLKALPEFDIKKASKSGLDAALKNAQDNWNTSLGQQVGSAARAVEAEVRDVARDARDIARKDVGAADRDVGTADAAAKRTAPADLQKGASKYPRATARWVRGSAADDYKVFSRTERLGSIKHLVVDCSNGPTKEHVVAAIVSSGGVLGVGDTEYVIPFKALTLCQDGDDLVYCVDRDTKMLEGGVRWQKPAKDDDSILRADDLDRAKRFFEGEVREPAGAVKK